MASYHKPKMFRSIEGCCICKAKSSSSRFTDSGKYENSFKSCFQLNCSRSGDICNACVLIVKRWRNLPQDTQRIGHTLLTADVVLETKSAASKSKRQRKHLKQLKNLKKSEE